MEEEYTCQTICDGKLFWLQGSSPRKCTQSIVQLCSSLSLTAAPKTYIKKSFHKSMDCKKETTCLKRLNNCPGFPQILRSNTALDLDLSFAGDPIVPSNIPKDCRAQIKALGDSLAAANIRHNDLVPHNFLIDTSTQTISLIDFGRSSLLPESTNTLVAEKAKREQQQELMILAIVLCNSKELHRYQQKQLKPKYTTAVSRLKAEGR